MSSQMSSAAAKPRAPQRERGRARVAALLAAATAVIAESGYEAATMTEIAARAGASIGSLYQFFPTKELIADALHQENGEDLARMLAGLGVRVAGKPSAALADALFDDLSGFLNSHPAFIALAGRRNIDAKRKKQMRRLLRGQIAALLAQADPPVPAKRADILAVIVLHLIQTAVTIAGEVDLPNRAAVLDDLRLMLRRHMAAA
ncbi:MAG: TetR/AcrR family transcriptional regulator [Pseudolabrys sp.]|nr:TetR/AcrR family transcriptional regulator [Pseudolabrys sp.]